jgi:Flp pilus assembly protein TadG
MSYNTHSRRKVREQGQSLVEVVLFLPIFVILLAGLVEVSQLVVAQNRVTNAARVGARFGANGGGDDGIVITALDSITQTLGQNPSQWDIWTVRGKVDSNGTGFDEWSFTHAYGISNTARYGTVSESAVKAGVLTELQTGGNTATAGIEVVGAYLMYDVESILGLNALPLVSGINSVQELSVMRVVGFRHEADTCDAFPIAVHEGIRSVNPPGTGANPFPDPNDFGPGSPIAVWSDYRADNVEDIPWKDAKEGYVYKIKNGFGSGNFGWLRWNQGRPDDANTLADSLDWPGDSVDYTPTSGGSGMPAGCAYDRVRGYMNSRDCTSTQLIPGSWVAANTGNVNSSEVRQILNEHISTKGRQLRVIVWDESENQGNYGEYRVKGFAIVELLGYNLTGNTNNSWILVKFIKDNSDCTSVVPGP